MKEPQPIRLVLTTDGKFKVPGPLEPFLIARLLGITQQDVQQITKRALAKMRYRVRV